MRFLVQTFYGLILESHYARRYVKIYPNCWDQVAGGQVDSGYTYDEAAVAEVNEEVGLQNDGLKTIATYRYNSTSGERISAIGKSIY